MIALGTTITITPQHIPSLKIKSAISIPKSPNNGNKLIKHLKSTKNILTNKKNNKITTISPLQNPTKPEENVDKFDDSSINKMQIILDAVLARIEKHNNLGKQRENWNTLLLNSINMTTLAASTMAAFTTVDGAAGGSTISPAKMSAVLLFAAATGLLMIMNKIQPSQLVEEQRNAVRLFKKLHTRIQTRVSTQTLTHADVENVMDEVLALDRAYPLPLLGAMLDKFPETFKPAKWWPTKTPQAQSQAQAQARAQKVYNNGWSEELEEEMREIVKVIKKKDVEDYERLGNKALKLNKMLATMGPVLTGIAAMGSAFSGHGGAWAGLVAAAAGSMASVVNTIEHGGQVGMVFEMYRNCAGFFSLVEETVESNLEECDFDKRENGELFEMKMALNLGRSLSELRDLANTSKRNGQVDEFASKLF